MTGIHWAGESYGCIYGCWRFVGSILISISWLVAIYLFLIVLFILLLGGGVAALPHVAVICCLRGQVFEVILATDHYTSSVLQG